MRADLPRSHKLWRFLWRGVGGRGHRVVTCIFVREKRKKKTKRKKVQDSVIPYVIFCHVNFRFARLCECVYSVERECVCVRACSRCIMFLSALLVQCLTS